jgi:hypothetical protein
LNIPEILISDVLSEPDATNIEEFRLLEAIFNVEFRAAEELII